MKTIKYLLSGLALCLYGCVEDEGNYNYVEINDLVIENLPGSANVMSEIDSLHYSPVLKGDLDEKEVDDNMYTFKWQICNGVLDHQHTVISHEKNLNYKVDVKPGSYTLYFFAKNNQTGIERSWGISLNVITPITRGFLLLGDKEDGTIGLDMISMPGRKDTTVIEDVFDNSEMRLTGADKLIYAGDYMGDGWQQTLWMMTKEGSYRMTNAENFDIINEVNESGMIETEFEHKRIQILDLFPGATTQLRSNMYRGYITEDLVVFNSIILGEYFSTPLNKTTTTSTTLFKPYPQAFHAGYSRMAYNFVVIYDMDDQCFRRIQGLPYSATHCATMSDYPSDPFPWNQTDVKRTIVYGENTIDDATGSSLVLMKGEDGGYIVYKFRCPTSSYYLPTKLGSWSVDTNAATDLNKATHYAFTSNREAIVYAVGSKLYQYDYTRNQLTSTDLKAEITFMKAEYCSTGQRDQIIVATYDSTNKGTVRKFSLGSDANKVEFIERPKEIWNTKLKVKDVEWKIDDM